MAKQDSPIKRSERQLARAYWGTTHMHDLLIIEHPDPHSLILKKTRAGGLRNLIGTVIFFVFWYGILFAWLWPELWRRGGLVNFIFSIRDWVWLLQTITSKQPMLGLFILVPLLALPKVFKAIKISLFGEVFLFDAFAKTVSRDGKQKAMFGDIRGVELRYFSDEDSNDYRVSVLLNSGSSLYITESNNHEQMANAAADIASVLNTEVVKA
jgi:hypothetical protein